MKRTIVFLFLLFVKCIILTHAIIPHHHHDQVTTCFPQNHHLDCGRTYHHNDGDCHHNSDHHIGECITRKEFTITNNDKLTNIIGNCSKQLPNYHLLFYTQANNRTITLDGMLFRQKPCIPFYHVVFIFRSLRLRAPPFC